jgi:hypothetical protein
MVRADLPAPYATAIVSVARLDICAGNTVTLAAPTALRLVERKQATYMSPEDARHPHVRHVLLLQDVFFPPSTWMRIHPAGARTFISHGTAKLA